MIKLAPIVLFVYNRPWHTQQTVEALQKNDLATQSELFIYADGAKTPGDPKVKEVREYIKTIRGFRKISIIEREKNWGLADNIVDGVTNIVNQYGKIIVLEDDIMTAQGFLSYMNNALELYQHEEKVMHISGYNYPIETSRNDTFFMKCLSCWGWATWKRAWKQFDDDVEKFMSFLDTDIKIKEFNIGGNANFYEQLRANYLNQINTWAVKWYASWYFSDGLSLFPYKSLVVNIGHDGTGTNSSGNKKFDSDLINAITLKKIDVKENIGCKKKVNQCLAAYNFKNPRLFRFKEKIRGILSKIITKIIPEIKVLIINRQGLTNILTYNKNNIIKENVKIDEPSRIFNSKIGKYTYISVNSRISEATIGKFCSIGPNFHCGWGVHPIHGITTSPMFYSNLGQNGYVFTKEPKIEERKKIHIGNDVFIGMNVTIIDGVTIGDGAIIGAGAVVTTDVQDYAVVGGVPAKLIKYRFSNEVIQRLKSIEWWNWPENKLYLVEKFFFDIETFIKEAEKI